MPHVLGKMSIARKADEMEEETGKEPTRGEMFIASRTRSDGSFVCDEARISVDKLKQVTQNIKSEAPNNDSKANDAFEQVFGPERSGRVRCAGRGLTPSKYFSNLEFTSFNAADIIEIKACLNDYGEKLDIVTNALYTLVKQMGAKDENTKLNTNLHQSSSINSEQESGISKTRHLN